MVKTRSIRRFWTHTVIAITEDSYHVLNVYPDPDDKNNLPREDHTRFATVGHPSTC